MNLHEAHNELSGKVLQAISEKLGIHRQTLRAWALGYKAPSGNRRRPTMDQIYELERAHPQLKSKDLIKEFYPKEG